MWLCIQHNAIQGVCVCVCALLQCTDCSTEVLYVVHTFSCVFGMILCTCMRVRSFSHHG